MTLFTPVVPTPSSFSIDHTTPMLLVGSCFTDSIGAKLQAAGFEVLCNPFGTLYNPLSIALCMRHALADTPIDDRMLVQHEGVWHSWLHHSRFSNPDKDLCLKSCNEAIHTTHQFLQLHPVLLFTFGTAYAFFRDGQVVANCHKLPPQTFLRRRLAVQEIVEEWRSLMTQIDSPHLIFTVSPIRHLADTAHGNQLSKSTLLLALDQLGADYFPSYEILLDELRDYRFYARDLCHPSDVAVDIVWERFQQTYMSPATRNQCLLNEKQFKHKQHKQIVNSD